MTTFLRLLSESDKAAALAESYARVRSGEAEPRRFEVAPAAFDAVPGKPFAYWVSEAVRETFGRLPAFKTEGRTARRGPSTCDDARYLRLWWEISSFIHGIGEWRAYSKGGVFSPFFADIYLLVDWEPRRSTSLGFFGRPGREIERPESVDCFFRAGLTWPRRTSSGLSLRVLPADCIFADKGPAAFVAKDDPEGLLGLLAITNSRAFGLLVSLQLAAADAAARSYEVGVIQRTPVPDLTPEQRTRLAALARRAWSLKRTLDTVHETSHAFLLPAALRPRLGNYDPNAIAAELADIQAGIDAIAFDLYGFADADRAAALGAPGSGDGDVPPTDDDDDDEAAQGPADADHDALLAWAVGVAFGRFDWRLANGERAAPPEPDPFDPLPAKSPGMLPDGAAPFHAHAGILVEDQGHPHDLARLVEEVLARVDVAVPDDVRRWVQRDLFPFHLQRYSRSRRKAPLYWPLAATAGTYRLWVYYPSLTSQTLYTAINDFVEPKLTQVGADVTALRNKGANRTRDDERQFEALQALELEMIELRDTLLRLAPSYQPNHDDGVQLTAAPLWPLFRHKPWQRLLKTTWERLENGDYDWAHLALCYWPERVREKCRTDKSLAIAHGLEGLYVAPPPKPKPTRVRDKQVCGAQ